MFRFPKITEQPYVLSLSPYAFLWFELQLSSAMPEYLIVPRFPMKRTK